MSIFAKKEETGSQNPTRQTRHSWRIGRQKWEVNEIRKKKENRDRERKLPPKKNKPRERKGRNAIQES
jgi:hypothetical protein